jgi:diguanylate cyclase (GGDEF)-like protein/PAS domain S-box-containing protein
MALLIVDDEESNRDMLSRRLKRQGFSVNVAEDGPQALDCVRNQALDLVLLDIRMPGMSGMEVLKGIRERYSPTQLPVIMVTAESNSASIVEALDLGANDYITKPVDLPVALARIRTHLSQKTLQEALRESEERYALAARGANDGLWDWNLKTGEIYLSARWKEMIGYPESEIGNQPEEWFSRVHPDDRERLRAAIEAHRRRHTPQLECEQRMLAKDGTYRWMLTRGLAVWDSHGEATRMAGSQTDITVAKVADPLTGLPNRLLFMDRLERLIEYARRRKDHKFAVLFLDVDRFKNVNDSLGHLIGDRLLQAITARLRKSLRSADTLSRLQDEGGLARLGGDEFAVLLDEIHQVQDAVTVAERIAAELQPPFLLEGHEMFASVSIGIAASIIGYEKSEDLLRDADTAMYCAKEAGRARFQIFDVDMRTRAVTRLQVETDLRRAIERQELRLFYQPIVDLRTGNIAGFEGLVRWQHPLRGMVCPADFIPLAEETGLIVPVGSWVLEQACRDMARWRLSDPGHPPLTMHVNFSNVQLIEARAIEEIERIVRRSNLESHGFRLNFEITESAMMQNPGAISTLLSRLKDLHIGLDIDDFGTGYSSLSQLQHLPVQTLKIDRSFIARIGQDDDSLEIIRTIVALAHNLGMDVVAEGVETAQQLVQLKALNCEYAQGYYFGRPTDSDTAWSLVSRPDFERTPPCIGRAVPPSLAARAVHPLS